MISEQQALDGLGEKVHHALGAAVSATRKDLEDYRSIRPNWVAAQSERGLSNWISDRLWHHVGANVESIADVQIVEYGPGPTRELLVGSQYRLRLKRHHLNGAVSNYPTQTAMGFFEQSSPQLPGMEEINLIAGYEWIADQRDVGRAVLSLRTSQDKIHWLVELPEDEDAAATVLEIPTLSGPEEPLIVVTADLGDEGEASEGP